MKKRKSVLITAGTKNTGFVIAKAFAAKGYDVHITGRNAERRKIAVEELKSEFPQISVYGYEMEMSSVSDIKRVFEEIGKNTESLDVFIANAANLGIGVDIYNADEEAFDGIIDVNVKGTFFCCRECAKLMKKDGGSIVLMSSVQSKGGVEGRTVYCISKAAENAMAKCLAYDLAPYDIRVNSLVIGAIHTERWDGLDDATYAQRRQAYPLKREADMADVANAVMFLSEDCSKMITGTELTIDSGVLVPLLSYKDRKNFKREDF